MRALVLLVCLEAATGCARQWAYDKPDADRAQRARDRAECEQDAEVRRVARPFVWEGGSLVSYPFMGVDPQVYKRCMEAKGYTVSPN
jgi:hypothetical protein